MAQTRIGWRDAISRRHFWPAASALVSAGCSSAPETPPGPPGKSPVFVAKASSYRADLESILRRGIAACGLAVKGKNILLKPNLVEFDSATCVNTNVAVLVAARSAFQALGAASVTIGEGPGHRRDTIFLAEEADYRQGLERFDNSFIDLNRDDVTFVKNVTHRGGLYLPNTALAADLIVSVAKMKTHHWAGATLTMKNFFGLVPGSVYGWPKNELHHIGIAQSILALNKTFPRTFGIVDGIVGMEGNGPIQGTPKPAGVLVMGPNLPAIDATCCRIMGIDPNKLEYLTMAREIGHIDPERIEQRGESADSVRTPFGLIEEFAHVRLA
ncbi:MAG: DUF362 domain-containing protein [Acidobacteria bacterium]|nr:DUF362 domain-containing protein [Acidobacteriota bacterium]